jgi:site-specific recombinase XerD
MALGDVDDYLQAADRESTLRSYAACIRHFEQEWQGLLPATSESVARYLAAYAPQHAISTLRQRVAALARWHADHGFADPTRTPMVRKVLKGIRATHTSVQRKARPLELDQLDRVNAHLQGLQMEALQQGTPVEVLRLTRDRSLLLLGFWRAFRSDELTRVRIEDVEVVAGKGLTCRLPRSKGDREFEGRTFHCPALSRLCAVEAYSEWVKLLGRTSGPVFPAIDRWGHISDESMRPTSVIPLLRGLFAKTGLDQAKSYSSHSLRRGFAGWARSSGWDIKELMAYVGWKDVDSALRYLDAPTTGLQQRFERSLAS